MQFSVDHVNILCNSIDRNTQVPHRFVCVTDDWVGLRDDIDVIDANHYFGQFKKLGGCYRRLKAFDRIDDFGNKFISMDLDVVVCGNLDAILSFKEPFKIWEDKYRRRTPYCGSLWGMETGCRKWVWDEFSKFPTTSIAVARVRKFIGTDQAHISRCLYPNEATWGTEDGVYNFATRVRRAPSGGTMPNGEGEIIPQNGKNLPEGARLVFFNGKFDPSQQKLQKQYPWIADFWRE